MTARGRYAAVPLVGLSGILLVSVVLDRRETFEPAWLLPLLNLVFLTIIPASVATLAFRAYRATGVPAVLGIGAGMVATAIGCGLVPGLLITLSGPNAGITVHNVGALIAGLCQVAAIVVGPAVVPRRRTRVRHLLLAYGGITLLLIALIVLVMAGATPPFIVPGTGTTVLRGVVLGSGAGSFAFAALHWWQVWQRNTGISFLRWYALALGLFALGLAGVMTQNGAGGLVSWLGRIAQFTAAVYFVVAIVQATPRRTRDGDGSDVLGAALIQSVLLYRPMIESIGEVLITVNRRGETLYWNRAAQDLFGRGSAEVLGRPMADLVAPAQRRSTTRDDLLRMLQPGHRGEARTLQATLIDGGGRAFPAELVFHAPDVGADVVVCVVRDVTERVQAEAEIRELNRDLEQRVLDRTAKLTLALEELETFSYSVSHDLRAPVRAINGFATLLQRHTGAVLDEQGRHYVDTIATAGAHMGVLIEELLEYSRLGRGQVRREPVPLEPILERLTTTFAERIAATGTTLELATPLAVPLGDPLLVEQILANLLDNALTYRRTDVTPQVTIAAVRGGDTVTLSIADNGIGIAQAHQEKIFEVFARLHRDDEYPGTGIGLATVRKSARLMGSDVTLTSVEGEGTTFTFVLPAAEAG